jgi:hypothetical protein
MISQNELDAIINGKWIIDCPIMSLIPACAGTESYQGAGYIEQGEKHKLRFKLISAQKTDFSFRPEPTQTGQLYAPEEHWRLSAKDIHGREWISKGILPDVLYDDGAVFTGSLRDLDSSELDDLGDGPRSIKLWLLGDFKVTCNQSRITATTVGGEQVSVPGERSHVKFVLGQRDFLLRKEKAWLFLEVRSPTCSFQPSYADRIEEALEFVLGRPARATVLLKNDGALCSLQIRSVASVQDDVYAKPPYPAPIKDKEGYFWRLFGLHLNYIEAHNSTSRSPLARAWQYFIDSRDSALEVRALTLGVGIEALLRVSSTTGESDTTLQLEAAKKVINAAELDEGIKKRVLGAIEGMRQISPTDRLHQLVKRGVMRQDQFQAWKRLRHRAAHAGDFSLDDATIRDCNLVLTAAHRIVFDVLGYQGAYRDYGTPAWPELTYPETLST